MSNQTPPTPVLADESTAPAGNTWRAGSWSETGIYHPTNEDKIGIQPANDNPLFCGVSDGVGGGSMGHIASAALIDYCMALDQTILADNSRLSSWFSGADAAVAQQIARHSNKPGAATMVGLWFLSPRTIRVIHVGDCRLYRFNEQGELSQLTQDQTYQRYQQAPPAGGSPDDPARMVGVGAIGSPEINDVTLEAGDCLLLCSDGLHKFVPSNQLSQLLADGIQQNQTEQQICQQLVRAAKQAGSHDDVSALLLRHYPAKNHWKIGAALLLLILVAGLLLWWR